MRTRRTHATPRPSATNEAGVIDIQLYVDYLCGNCGTFEKNNADQLRQWVGSGAATLEIHGGVDAETGEHAVDTFGPAELVEPVSVTVPIRR